MKMKKRELEVKRAFIREFPGEDDNDELSLIDLKAAIAKQGIPISELYSNQDIASNRSVISLIHDAEAKLRTKLENEIVVLKSNNAKLQAFRDKAETTTLVQGSKELTDQPPRVIEYIKARLSTGRGVDMTGDLTDDQRQERVNLAVKEELALIKEQGITFKSADSTKPEDNKDYFEDKADDKDVDMTNPENNPLIAGGEIK